MNTEWINLPFEIQLFLASGYIAYRVAAIGLEKTHQKTDIFFQILIYGVVAKFAYDITQILVEMRIQENLAVRWIAVPVAFLLPTFVAALWRKYGKPYAIRRLDKWNISKETMTGPVLPTIIHDVNCTWAYVSVKLTDGRFLESNLAALPTGLINKAGLFDEDGNVAIYITSRTDADGKVTVFEIDGDVLDEHKREHLTYIPSSQIANMTVSRIKRNS